MYFLWREYASCPPRLFLKIARACSDWGGGGNLDIPCSRWWYTGGDKARDYITPCAFLASSSTVSLPPSARGWPLPSPSSFWPVASTPALELSWRIFSFRYRAPTSIG
ncbi:hypothetical protein BOTBODRAFT_332759 [Botryobasidium botryosum FD-172 SS1]|uniref:Uncharacterized protein n=1 Tax=Botryobasidium botryosum (strain FD-172 SS1) TaxID=930990 RepID=A0A067MHB9_BOTB1|nr:hypothetical protein BOTBODRAFT_332759 [Botryobasidium botryosum FD-172 SS1]